MIELRLGLRHLNTKQTAGGKKRGISCIMLGKYFSAANKSHCIMLNNQLDVLRLHDATIAKSIAKSTMKCYRGANLQLQGSRLKGGVKYSKTITKCIKINIDKELNKKNNLNKG